LKDSKSEFRYVISVFLSIGIVLVLPFAFTSLNPHPLHSYVGYIEVFFFWYVLAETKDSKALLFLIAMVIGLPIMFRLLRPHFS